MAGATPVITYNMHDLAVDVANEFELSQKDASQLVRFMFDQVKEKLKDGRQVRLHAFGTLMARKRAAGIARNPKTNERVTVPARRVLKMVVSARFKQELQRR